MHEMIQQTPAISVVLPVFNGGIFLEAAIKSVLAQSFTDFELIILNDGSTDQSIKVIQQYASQDSRIVVVDRENRGLVATLNEGVQLARANIIARMDSDDISHPHRFMRQMHYLTLNPECVAVGSRVHLIDPDGLPIMEMGNIFSHDEIDTANMLGTGSFICHPTAMFRRDAVILIGGYREEYRYAEDIDFFLRLAEIGRLANLPEVLLEYRQHLTSIGYSQRPHQIESCHAAVREACIRRKISLKKIDFAEQELSNTDLCVSNSHIKWAWWALAAKNIKTARKHAIKAVIRRPAQLQGWKVLACSIRGY